MHHAKRDGAGGWQLLEGRAVATMKQHFDNWLMAGRPSVGPLHSSRRTHRGHPNPPQLTIISAPEGVNLLLYQKNSKHYICWFKSSFTSFTAIRQVEAWLTTLKMKVYFLQLHCNSISSPCFRRMLGTCHTRSQSCRWIGLGSGWHTLCLHEKHKTWLSYKSLNRTRQWFSLFWLKQWSGEGDKQSRFILRW